MPADAVRDVVYGAFQRPIRAMRAMDKPVIAAVDGPALGAGCEIALAADVRIASVAAPQLMDATLALAHTLAAGPPRALAAAKAAINRGLASTLWAELDASVADQLACFQTADFAEGVRALAERRPPTFTGT